MQLISYLKRIRMHDSYEGFWPNEFILLFKCRNKNSDDRMNSEPNVQVSDTTKDA